MRNLAVSHPKITGSLARRVSQGKNSHGHDVFDVKVEDLTIVGYSFVEQLRESDDGNAYTATVKVFLPHTGPDITAGDKIICDPANVFTVREAPKSYRAPWGTYLGEHSGRVVYAERAHT